jgi:hypothetical protein
MIQPALGCFRKFINEHTSCLKDNRQRHHNRDRQPRTDNVNAAEQLLLPENVPRLLKILKIPVHLNF